MNKNLKPIKYAIVDIETTGGMSHRDKITEIGIVIHDGEKIVDSWESLINPERNIPANITRITGITNDMVQDAPKFFEVAKKVVELTEGAIFVAHNVRFDYGFIKNAFENLGYTYTRKQLCTVRLTRKSFPGLRSYALGNLIKHFDIKVNARHRALDDAMATAIIFGYILKQEDAPDRIKTFINSGIKESKLPKNINMEYIHNLPEQCGVYFFYNTYGTPIYIGKSINIKKRIIQHFSKTTKKAEKLQKYAHSISFELTGSELASKLLESELIKAHQPEINKAQKTKEYPYFVYYYYDDSGYLRIDILKSNIKNRRNKEILGHFKSIRAAKNIITNLVNELGLCGEKCSISEKGSACMQYKMHQCYGACRKEESPIDYNERAFLALPFLMKKFDKDEILIDIGRKVDELSVFLIEDGHYRGFGYISKELANLGIEEMLESIRRVRPNPEMNGIIKNHLYDKKVLRRIPL